jgi:hypothetical protein
MLRFDTRRRRTAYNIRQKIKATEGEKMTNNIDASVLKYIPESLKGRVTWAEKWRNYGEKYYCICVAFNFSDEGIKDYEFIAHGTAELKWACQRLLQGFRGEMF